MNHELLPPKRRILLILIISIGLLFLVQSWVVPILQVEAEVSGGLAPAAVSADGHYLVDANGAPFSWMGDTAWDMHHRLTMEEIEIYLDDRQQKGFNVILFRIPFKDLDGEPQRTNPYGHTPFIDQDITQPSEDFFQLVDFTLTEMEERGMTAGILPLWGFVLNDKYGFSVSDDDVRIYAQWLSSRYSERENIVWVVGGDTNKNDKWITLGTELKPADPDKLITFHPGRNLVSSYHLWGDVNWLDFHMTQTGHSPNLKENYQTLNYVYNNSSKPIINGEPVYEDIRFKPANGDPYPMPPHQVRKAAYWSLLAGGFGHVYGHVEIFQFAGAMPGQPYTFGADGYWMDALDAPGALQISSLSTLLRSVPWHTFAPWQTLISSDNPVGPSHIRAARSADQTRAFIYFPEQQTATITLSEMTGPLSIYWFDPQTGQSQLIGTFAATGTIQADAPFAEDSLLILGPEVEPTSTPTPSPTVVPTDTPTRDPAASNTPSSTATFTPTATATDTPSPTATATLISPCEAPVGELVRNGHFEDGTEEWRFSTAGSGSIEAAAPAFTCNLAMHIHINDMGKNTQLFQSGVALKANTTYRLTFAAYSETGNDLTTEIIKHTSPYTNYGLGQRFDLGTGWQEYTVDFTTSGFSGMVSDGRFRFRLHGADDDDYWIDAVSLVELYASPPTETATPTAAPPATATHTPTAAAPPTETATPDPAATNTSTPTATNTLQPSLTPTNTASPTAIATQSSSCSPAVGEHLGNSHFEQGTAEWRFSTDGSGTFSAAAPAYTCDLAARVYIKKTGKNTQLFQQGVQLKANTAYRLTFAAYSTSGNDLTTELLKHTRPYTNYGLSQRFDLSTAWQSYAVDFTTSGFSGTVNDGRFRFRLYADTGETYWFDAVSLIELNTAPPAETPTPTATALASQTHTPTPTALPTETPTPDPAASPTPTATSTNTPEPTATSAANPTATATPASSCHPQPGELLVNGSFEEGTVDWRFTTEGSGSFITSSPAYSCDLAARVRIKVSGKNMQLYQHSVPLRANTAYRLSFAAYSTSGKDLTTELLKHTTPYTNYGLTQRFDLGSGWQFHTVEFTTSGFTGSVDDGRLRFRLYGSNNDIYWIDSVSLVEISSSSSTARSGFLLQEWRSFVDSLPSLAPFLNR